MFQGSLVAVITPFTAKGRVESGTLERLVQWHISEGSDGIVCCGATGEAPSLSFADRKKIIEICVQTAQNRIPIIAGTGTPDTKETVRLTELAQRLGATGALVITPYYNKPSQRGCVLHYREVARVGLPLIVYHNPGRTQVWLTVETLTEMGTIPGVVGVKEASGDINFITELKTSSSIPILSGDDWLSHETIKRGGVGAISTIGNLFPRAWKEMIALTLQGRWAEGQKISDRFAPFCQTLFTETNPQCVKYLLSLRGKCKAVYRLPLVIPLSQTQTCLKRELVRLALPFSSVQQKIYLS